MKLLPIRSLVQITSLIFFAGTHTVQAQSTYFKQNNANNLNLNTSWQATSGLSVVNAGPPTSTDIGKWDNTVTAANATVLGADSSWAGIVIANPGGAVTINTGNTLTLGASGIDMSGASQNLTLNCGLTLSGAQTWNVGLGRTDAIGGTSLSAGANLLTITGAGNTTVNNSAIIASTGGITKTGAGKLTILGGANQHNIGSSTLTVNGGIVDLNNPVTVGTANPLATTANLTLGGGAFEYTYAVNLAQSLATLTVNPGEAALWANRNGSFNTSLTIAGAVTRNIGGTINARTFDGSRGNTVFSTLTASTLVKDANGTAFLISGDVYSGTSVNFENWGALDGSKRVVAATYTSITATDVGTSAQNANVPSSGVTACTLAANAVDACFRDVVNQATIIDLNGKTWQTGGILIGGAKITAGSIIKDTPGTGSLTGPANSDLTLFISANVTTPQPFTINAKIIDNTSTTITKGAPGTLILSGNNTFTGGVHINDGTIQLGNVGALNSATPNAINFNGSGMVTGIASTTTDPVASAPTLALAGNSVSVASLSTANNLSGSIPVIKNANGSSVANVTLTINGSATTTFTGTIQDGTGGGTLSLAKSGAGTQTIGGTLSYSGLTTVGGGTLVLANAPSATAGYVVTSGTLNVSSLGTVALTSSQLLSGSGSVNGTMSTIAATTLAPGSGTSTTGGSGILNITNLTIGAGTVGNFGLSVANANNCQINIGTLTLPASGTMTLNLYSPGTATPFAAAGTYNLFQYNSIVNGTSLATRFTIGTSISGFAATYGTAAGPNGTTYLTLTLTAIVAGVDATWNTDFDGNWTDATKWSSNPSVPSVPGDLATFGTGSVLRTVTLNANESVGGITMNNNNSFVIANAGSTLTLDNSGNGVNVVVSGGTLNAIQSTVSLNDNAFLTVNSGKSLSVSGTITNTSGAKTLTINGAGTNILSGANTYGPAANSAGTTLSGGGTVQVGNNTSLGAGDVNVNGNNTIKAGAATLNIANNVILGVLVNATVDNNGNNLTLGGVISGSGSLNQTGAGVLTLSGANTYAGNTTNAAGTLKLGASNVIPDGSGKGDVVISGTLDLNGNSETVNGLNGAGTVDNVAGGGTSTLTVGGNNANSSVSALIQNTTGTVALTKIGSGSLTLSGANTYNGGTTFSSGQLNINNSGSGSTSSAIGTGTLTIGGGTIDNTSAGDVTLSPAIPQNWNGDFTYAGSIHNLNLGNGAITMSATRSVTVSANILTVGGAISGSTFGLAKLGSGKLILTGNNSFTGPVTVGGGNLTIGGGTFGSATSDFEVGNGIANVVFTVTNGTATARNFNLDDVANSGAGQSSITVNGSATFAQTQIGSSGNTAGALTINTAGTVNLGAYLMGRDSGSIAANASGGLIINGGTVTATSVSSGSGVGGRATDINIGGGSLTVGNSGSSGAFLVGGGVNSAGYVTMTGGSLTYLGTDGLLLAPAGGAATATANLSITAATANLTGVTLNSQNSATLASSKLILGTGATLYLGGVGLVMNQPGANVSATFGTATVGAMANWSSSAPITLTGAPVTFQAADSSAVAHNITLNGVLSGAGGLTMTGSGVLTLGTANTYFGATSVSNGTLLVTGSIGTNTVTVTNAILGGTGIIAGTVTLQPNAVLAAGIGGVGTLTITNLTLNALSTNTFAVTTAGGASNKVAVAGALTPNSSVIKVTSGTVLRPGTYTLFTYGSVSGTFNPTVMFDVAPVHPASIVDDTVNHINLVVSNAAPVAGATFTLGVTLGLASTVQIVGGKYPPTDADGDALTITNVSGAANGTVTTDGTNITYTATNGVTDSFSYTVSDGLGGTASQTINVTISPAGQGYNLLSAQTVAGQAVLTYYGIPGHNYALDWTHDLTPPPVWTPLVTNTAASDGKLVFTNTPSGGNDFYRTRYVP